MVQRGAVIGWEDRNLYKRGKVLPNVDFLSDNRYGWSNRHFCSDLKQSAFAIMLSVTFWCISPPRGNNKSACTRPKSLISRTDQAISRPPSRPVSSSLSTLYQCQESRFVVTKLSKSLPDRKEKMTDSSAMAPVVPLSKNEQMPLIVLLLTIRLHRIRVQIYRLDDHPSPGASNQQE